MKNLILLFTALLMLSCAARKTNTLKSESETKTEATVTQTAVSVTETTKNELITTSEENYVLVPIDSTKPIEVTLPNGKKTIVANARIEHKKTNTTAQAQTKSKDTTSTVKVAAVKTGAKVATHAKATEREAVLDWRSVLSSAALSIVGAFLWWLIFIRKKKTNASDQV